MTITTQAKLTASAPVLLVKDLVTAVEYYRDAFGFEHVELFGEPPHFAIVGRDGLRVMLKQAAKPEEVVPNWTISKGLWDIYFWVDDVDAIYAEMKKRGAKIDYELCNQPHGCREFGVQDADGHDIAFGQVVG